jgi:hypothetical protein
MDKLTLGALCLLSCTVGFAAVPDGYVVKVDSTEIYLDWGAASGVQVNDRFQVFREGETLKHPVTGEVLGHEEVTLGNGHVETVDPKFSIGHLDQTKDTTKAGDRIRWQAPAMAVPAAAAVPVVVGEAQGTDLKPPVPTIQELWRSEALEKDPVGIAFSDVDGDGQKDIIIAYRAKIVVYRWKDKKLEPLAKFDDRKYRHWLTVDAADLKKDGHEEIFATAYVDSMNRPRMVALRYENGALKRVGEIEGFVRLFQRMDGSKHLYWQTFSRSSSLNYTDVCEVIWQDGKYQTGKPLGLKLFPDQLFGFAWGNWYKSGAEEFAVLEHGDRIRIYSEDVKWKSDETYGGTKNDFPFDNNVNSSVQPRLMAWKPAGSDRDELIIPTNVPALGVRFTNMKLYNNSQLDGLVWNGLEMKSTWRIPIKGYTGDYGIADLMGQSKPQLWVVAAGPGDKTILLSYSLP